MSKLAFEGLDLSHAHTLDVSVALEAPVARPAVHIEAAGIAHGFIRIEWIVDRLPVVVVLPGLKPPAQTP